MRRVVWGLAGLVLGGAGTFAAGMALPAVMQISQAEGAYAMGVAFVWTPAGALIGAILALILAGGRAGDS